MLNKTIKIRAVDADAFEKLLSKMKKSQNREVSKMLSEYDADRGKTESIETIITECPEFHKRTKSQGVQAKLEMFYLELAEKYKLSNAETVKIAAKFNSTMVGLVDDIKTDKEG